MLNTWLEWRGEIELNLVFVGQRGALTPSAVFRRLCELGQQAKVDLSPHTLRHTMAKNLIDAGVGMEKDAALLGHSRLNTTAVYTTSSERD